MGDMCSKGQVQHNWAPSICSEITSTNGAKQASYVPNNGSCEHGHCTNFVTRIVIEVNELVYVNKRPASPMNYLYVTVCVCLISDIGIVYADPKLAQVYTELSILTPTHRNNEPRDTKSNIGRIFDSSRQQPHKKNMPSRLNSSDIEKHILSIIMIYDNEKF